jgi:hypothetical protein
MKGLYLYCFIKNTAKHIKPPAKGVDFGGPVYMIRYRDVEAVVSNVSIFQQGEEIEEKLQHDIEWTKRNITSHHQVIASMTETNSTIPLRFGTIVNDESGLNDILQEKYAHLRKTLNELASKEEWGVKIFRNDTLCKDKILSSHQEVQQIAKQMTKAPMGKRWYLERKREELLQEHVDTVTQKTTTDMLDTLGETTKKMILNPLPDPQTFGEVRQIANAACLVQKDDRDALHKEIEKLNARYLGQGFRLEATGPWPPYNFV